MSPQRRWWSLVLFSLIAAAAIGTWGCCSAKYCDTMARVVAVPDVEMRLVPPIVISKKAHQEIVWRLSAGSTVSYVKITLGKNPPPFDNCEEMSDACRISCRNLVCLSGPIKESLSVPPEGLTYNYDFRRADSTASADPEIRIDP